MGLDMYLYKKTYVQNWNHMKPTERHVITIKGPRAEEINPERISEVVEQVLYWRKANAIHNWFVQNCQDGVDDCKEYYVSKSKLEELLSICKKVIETAIIVKGQIKNGETFENGEMKPIMEEGMTTQNAEEIAKLLPTSSGFFFGSTDYDEYYMQDIRETKDGLEKILQEQGGDFYYRASW